MDFALYGKKYIFFYYFSLILKTLEEDNQLKYLIWEKLKLKKRKAKKFQTF